MTAPIRSLQDLKPLRRQIEQARQQARAAALEAARREAERRHQVDALDARLFARTVGPVHPLRETLHGSPRLYLRPAPPPPIATQQQLDDQAVLRATLSDEFDVSTLLETDDQLSFRRPGVGPDVTRKLRRGEWSIQRELDLHGLRTDDARQALADFIRSAVKHGLRCVRVIHGKGLGSPGKTPVLKSRVQGWLVQKNEVLAFVQAKPAEGGAGALLVLLQGSR